MNRVQDDNPDGVGPDEGGGVAVGEPESADAVVRGALGWVFILIGSAAVAAASLIPAYMDTLDTRQARKELAVKAQMLADERQRYAYFHQALVDEDPVLIERLAISELRLKPVDMQVADRAKQDPVALVTRPGPQAIEQALRTRPIIRSIENELSRPDLKRQAVTDVELDRPRRTRLVTAATGEHRPFVMGFGALLLMMGLWPRRKRAA